MDAGRLTADFVCLGVVAGKVGVVVRELVGRIVEVLQCWPVGELRLDLVPRLPILESGSEVRRCRMHARHGAIFVIIIAEGRPISERRVIEQGRP